MLRDEQKQLAKDSAILFNAALSEIPNELVQEFKEEFEAQLAANVGATKATLPQIAEAVLNVTKDIAHEVGNPKVSALVDDIANGVEDAIDGKFFAMVADAIRAVHDGKALKKSEPAPEPIEGGSVVDAG